YNTLNNEGYVHLTVNHSLHFKDPETGVHSNTIESSWRHAKASISQYCRKKEFYEGYLAKFMFLKKCRAFKLDATAEFFKQAGILCSGTDDINELNDEDKDDDNDNDENRNNDTTSNSISSEVPLTIDLNDTDITKTVLPNDPALPLPKERIERNVKLSEGPCQIRSLSYPKTFFGNRLRSFQNAWYDNYDWLEY
ncbi:zinc finger MYM-type protein 1-like, partial [Aphis craccivora]